MEKSVESDVRHEFFQLEGVHPYPRYTLRLRPSSRSSHNRHRRYVAYFHRSCGLDGDLDRQCFFASVFGDTRLRNAVGYRRAQSARSPTCPERRGGLVVKLTSPLPMDHRSDPGPTFPPPGLISGRTTVRGGRHRYQDGRPPERPACDRIIHSQAKEGTGMRRCSASEGDPSNPPEILKPEPCLPACVDSSQPPHPSASGSHER